MCTGVGTSTTYTDVGNFPVGIIHSHLPSTHCAGCKFFLTGSVVLNNGEESTCAFLFMLNDD